MPSPANRFSSSLHFSGKGGSRTLNLHRFSQDGINTIIWATGYSFDFSWVKFSIFDEFGYPVQQRGVTPQPGLYFLGLHWLHTIKSGLLAGVGDDAAYVAEHIDSRD